MVLSEVAPSILLKLDQTGVKCLCSENCHLFRYHFKDMNKYFHRSNINQSVQICKQICYQPCYQYFSYTNIAQLISVFLYIYIYVNVGLGEETGKNFLS